MSVSLIVDILALRFRKNPQVQAHIELLLLRVYGSREYPTIHAVNGVPSLQQLTEGIEMDARSRQCAELLYDIGRKQFDHYVNNRDEFIQQKRNEMAEIESRLTQSEVLLAEEIGKSLAAANSDGLKEIQQQYKELSAEGQIYAQCKRRETMALQSIADDLKHNVPRTDYTSVKARITSGQETLSSLLGELPITWRRIPTIDRPVEFGEPQVRPPKLQYVKAEFLMEDTILTDLRAERDGDWVVSKKHNMVVGRTCQFLNCGTSMPQNRLCRLAR